MSRKKYIKKLGLRILVINIVFLAIKLFIEKDPNESYINNTTIFYYISAFILFMVTWEMNDYLLRQNQNSKASSEILTNVKILSITIVVSLSIAAVIYYLGIFELNEICQINAERPWQAFKLDMLRALGLSITFAMFNQFYWISQEKNKLEMSMLELKREIMTSKYSSLKSQISPHFLFNSLNTLTSLMYEDRDLASDFVTRLASCYRYILDNREEDLVSLEKELQFLDSFIFMMKVRHSGAIFISTDIKDELRHDLIPTLSIQMLVENALKHNYYSKEHPIDICVYTDNNRLIVENNIRKRKDVKDSTEVGLSNIKKRYAFYTDARVSIQEDDEKFIVSMPLIPKKEIKGDSPILNIA